MLNDYNAAERKARPIYSGVIKYFPDALLEVANLSRIGNEQHNPGQPLHWDRSKSQDEGDALIRHQIDAGTLDTDGVRHSAKVAWRALAQLQKELEAEAEARAYTRSQTADRIDVGLASAGSGINYERLAHPDADHSHDNGELPKLPTAYLIG